MIGFLLNDDKSEIYIKISKYPYIKGNKNYTNGINKMTGIFIEIP